MQHDPEETYAELEAECWRVGVQLHDASKLLNPELPKMPGLQAIGFDVAAALHCLRSLPSNAGTSMFLDCLRVSMQRFEGQPAEVSVPRQSQSFQFRPSIESLRSRDMREGPSLSEIGDHEEYLHTFVSALAGDAATRDRALERRGIYREYSRIFRAYLDNVGDGVQGTEALRRATFLLWCSASQPPCLTGVGEISESQEEEVIETLDEACADGTLDPQLRWMLGYYHGAYPEVFGRFLSAHSLQRILSRTFPEAWRAAEPEPRHFLRRGLMGRFWTQLIGEHDHGE